jgi:hypothetical protein
MKKQVLVLAKLITCLTLVLGFTVGWGADAALATVGCDPDFVVQEGSRFTVLPTGTDDTANLQCAFDAAVEAGPGAEVRLVAGAYHTAQIAVHEFHGSFTGAGDDDTHLYNLPDLFVAPEFWLGPPSADNPWPALFAFLDGDLVVSGLALHVVGEEPTLPWGDPAAPWTFLDGAFEFIGNEAYVELDHVLVEGELNDQSPVGYNLLRGAAFFGVATSPEPPPPLSGSFAAHNSTFRRHTIGIEVWNLANASVVVSHSAYEELWSAMAGSALAACDVEVSHNSIWGGFIGVDFYDDFVPELVDSSLLIANNVIRTVEYGVGVALEQTFGAGNECLLIGNNVRGVPWQGDLGIGILLREGVTGCTVVGGANKTNVLDLGTGNVLVGVNNMGEGVGPAIRRVPRTH